MELRNPLRTPLEELSGDMVGMWRTQAIRAAVELGVFEALPASAEDIEKSLELADSVGLRLMRALAELGLVGLNDKGVYHATDKGALLQRSHLHSMADAASLWGGETYEAWAEASYSLRTGRSAIRKQYGKNLFELLKDRPEQLQSSHRAFASYARHDYQNTGRRLRLWNAQPHTGRGRRHRRTGIHPAPRLPQTHGHGDGPPRGGPPSLNHLMASTTVAGLFPAISSTSGRSVLTRWYWPGCCTTGPTMTLSASSPGPGRQSLLAARSMWWKWSWTARPAPAACWT